LIAENLSGDSSTFTLKEAVALVKKKLKDSGVKYNNDFMNVEPIYRAAGWKVEYDQPGYNESGEGMYRFTAKK
jgi:hypothetical protein